MKLRELSRSSCDSEESKILRKELPCVWDHERYYGSVLRMWWDAWWWWISRVKTIVADLSLLNIEGDWRHGFRAKYTNRWKSNLILVIYLSRNSQRSWWHCISESIILSNFCEDLIKYSVQSEVLRTTVLRTISGHYVRDHDFLSVEVNCLQYRSEQLR